MPRKKPLDEMESYSAENALFPETAGTGDTDILIILINELIKDREHHRLVYIYPRLCSRFKIHIAWI